MSWACDFSEREETLKYISNNNIRILNLCHFPEDGKLKTLSFSITNAERISEILEMGERVDGSNLFSFVEPEKSDIYITPDIKRAFVDPFSTLPALNVLCDYLDENGKPLYAAPKSVLNRAEEHLRVSKGVSLKTLAELEFYIIAPPQFDNLFPGASDKNYHESAPFSKFQDIRNEILAIMESCGVPTKYAHGEVGLINAANGAEMEQHEIELKPQGLVKMAETIAVSKWIIRNVCARHGTSVSFIPKIDLNHAGTGMHMHLCGFKDGRNIVSSPQGTISNECLKIIGGILQFAQSLSSFGNPTPVSYLRFFARKESPMNVCWGARNRLALIRVPLWWSFKKPQVDMEGCRATFEYRASDAFSNPYLLFAGLTMAADYGLANAGLSTKLAENLHVDAAQAETKSLKTLPSSCNEAADKLEEDRDYYEANEVFPKNLIDGTIGKLRSFKDGEIWKETQTVPEKIEKMIKEYLHYG